jgi:hypothetical protein
MDASKNALSAKEAKVAIKHLEQTLRKNEMTKEEMCKMAGQLKKKLLAC